jgi:hypothetical protein
VTPCHLFRSSFLLETWLSWPQGSRSCKGFVFSSRSQEKEVVPSMIWLVASVAVNKNIPIVLSSWIRESWSRRG